MAKSVLTSIHGRHAGLTPAKAFAAMGGLTFGKDAIVNATASTLAVKSELHEGKIITLNRAAGIAVTLPAATGDGAVYTFILGTTVTSNSTTIKVANASDVFVGFVVQAADGGSGVVAYETAASDDTITLNGSTTGGVKGDRFRLVDVKLDGTNAVWLLDGIQSATGTEATPLSATV